MAYEDPSSIVLTQQYIVTLRTAVSASRKAGQLVSELEDEVPEKLRAKVLRLGLLLDDLNCLEGLLLTLGIMESKDD